MNYTTPEEKQLPVKIYICDPYKNTSCRGRGRPGQCYIAGGECCMTLRERMRADFENMPEDRRDELMRAIQLGMSFNSEKKK